MEYRTFEVVKSPTKPGPGWVKVTDEIVEKLIKFEEDNIRDLENLNKLIELSIIQKKAAE